MKLPSDITDQEMKNVMQEIWKEYSPEEDSNFINELNKEQLGILIDLISTKDIAQREKKREMIKQKIHESSESFKRILQKLKLTTIQVDEEKEKKDNNISLENLENQF